jgi:hypothetical protein
MRSAFMAMRCAHGAIFVSIANELTYSFNAGR